MQPVINRRDLGLASLLAFSLFCLYLAITRMQHVAYDSQAMTAVAHNLVDHLSVRTTGTPFKDEFGMATPYSPYGLGESLVLAPFYAISKVVGATNFWESLPNPLLVAASAGVLYLIGRSLRWSPLRCSLAALTFGALTMVAQSTTELFSEPGVGLAVALMVLAMCLWRRGWDWSPLLLGIALGIAIQFRTDSILTVCIGLLALPLFVPLRRLLRVRPIVLLAVPVVLSLALLVAYYEVRYGKPYSTYGGAFNFPILTGIKGLLISPGRGLFLYNPVAIVGLVGVIALAITDRALLAITLLLSIPRLILFSHWSAWQGGICWGPRFLMPIVSLITISAFALLDVAGGWSRAIRATSTACLLIAGAASVPLTYLSVRVPYEQWHGVIETASLRPTYLSSKSLIHTADGQPDIFATELWTWQGSNIRGNFQLLDHGSASMAPFWWRQGYPAVGWLLLLVFSEGSLATVWLALRSDHIGRDGRPSASAGEVPDPQVGLPVNASPTHRRSTSRGQPTPDTRPHRRVLDYAPSGLKTVSPADLLSLFIGSAGVTDSDFINAPLRSRKLRGHLRLKTEPVFA